MNEWENWQKNVCHLHQLIFVLFIFAVIILITKAWLSVMLVGEKLGKWRNKKLGGEIENKRKLESKYIFSLNEVGAKGERQRFKEW